MFFLVASALVVLASTQEEIEKTALEYRGYDELLQNITPLYYDNQTYYWIEYTRNLQYSGEVVLNGSLEPERNDSILSVFSKAYVIHKSYPKESVSQLKDFSSYFFSMHEFFNSSSNFSTEAKDALGISEELNRSARYLESGVRSFDPLATEDYLGAVAESVKKIDAAYEDYAAAKDAGLAQTGDYGNSLMSIRKMLVDNQKSLDTASQYMERSRYARTTPRSDQQTTETILVILSVLLMLAVFYMRSKRSNSSRQAPPPQA